MTDQKKKMKMAIISGASHALNFKKKEANLTDEEVLQKVNKESDAILEKIDSAY
jgi:hypothetical protein